MRAVVFRRVVTTAVLVLAATGWVEAIEPHTPADSGLSGPVRSVTEYNQTYSWNNQSRWVASQERVVRTENFDRDGRLVDRTTHGWSGNRDNFAEYTYHDTGVIGEVSIVRYDYEGNVSGYQQTVYDAAGELLSDEATNAEERVTSRFTRTETGEGYSLELRNYDSNGTLNSREFSTFDGQGRVVEEEKRPRTSSSRSTRRYEYDEAGRLATVTLLLGWRVQGTWEYGHDDAGRVREITHFGPARQSWSVRTYEYDGRGRLRSERAEHLDLDGLEHVWSYQYDLQGNVIREEYSQVYTDFVVDTTSEFLDTGQVVSTRSTDTLGRPAVHAELGYDGDLTTFMTRDEHGIASGYTEEFLRDSEGRLTLRTRYDHGDVWQSATRYVYDEVGHLIAESILNADGSFQTQTTYDNEYDEFGNWIRITRLVSNNAGEDYGRIHQVRTRRILYYE